MNQQALEAAALIALARMNVPPDVQDLLVAGDPMRGIPPGALRAAISAATTLPPVAEGELVGHLTTLRDWLTTDKYLDLWADYVTGAIDRITTLSTAVEALKDERDRWEEWSGTSSVRAERLEDTLEATESSLAEAQANSAADDLQIEALKRKIDALAPHGTCACSWDAPGETCLHHSPALAEAQLRIAGLEEALKPRPRRE